MSRFLDANDIAQQAKGRWINILSDLASNELGNAVNNFTGKIKKSSRFYCPVHGGKSGEAFTLYKDADQTGGGVCNSCGGQPDGFSLLMWIKGWDFRTTLEEVADSLRIESSNGVKPERKRKVYQPRSLSAEEIAQADKLIEKRDNIIKQCVGLNHPTAQPATRYFVKRGLSNVGLLGKEVLFHPKLPSWRRDKTGWVNEGVYPAIVSIIRNNKGEIRNIHRTFITDNGDKAPIESPRKLGASIATQPINGCSVHLCPPASAMAIAEGLETVLAVKEAYQSKLAVNCALNATLMGQWEAPVGVKTVVIFADLDESETGEVAAQKLYEKLEKKGLEVYIALPLPEESMSGVDWADVLELYGPDGFPELPFLDL